MGISRGNITTNIIKKGLVFNMDAANRGSYVPNATLSHNTINPLISGSLSGVTFTPSTGSGVWSFDGVDDYIDCGNGDSINITGALTVSAWINPHTSVNGNFSFVSKAGDYPNSNYILRGYSTGARFFLNGTTHSGNTASSFVAGQWVNLIGIFRPGQSVDLYWNGSLSNGATTSTSTTTISTITNPLLIGSNSDQSYIFDGDIGLVQIYNRALSASEVLFNYNGLKSRFGL